MIAIQAAHSSASALEDAAVEYDFGVVGKHADDFFTQAIVHRLLEGLMKPGKRLLLFQQSRPQGRVVRSAGLCLGLAHGRYQRRRGSGAHFPDEGAAAGVCRLHSPRFPGFRGAQAR
jgi:hypothetical protein